MGTYELFNNYADFVKSELKAVAVGIAQPQMSLGAVLELVPKKWGRFSYEFRRVGTLSSLCAKTEHRDKIKTELARVTSLEYPFKKETSQKEYQGSWKTKSSGFLGVVVPNTAEAKASMDSHSSMKLKLRDVTT